MPRVALKDAFIKSPLRIPDSGRADFHDAVVPGLALRVTSTGHRSFVLIARYPSSLSNNPTRRLLGEYGAVSLEGARKKARAWLEDIQAGRDPRTVEARQKAQEQQKQVNSFGLVAAAFLDRHASKLAKAGDARRTIEGEFVKRWEHRPVTEILPEEVAGAIRAIVDRGTPYQANNAFAYLRRMFSWAIGTHQFGITSSPVERLKPSDLIGPLESRERILTSSELRDIWTAAAWKFEPGEGRRVRSAVRAPDLGYPYGPLVRLLVLTGLRLREVAEMTWSEVDLDAALWTIPASRMKGKRSHEVPLAPDALALLKALPRFKGDFVFSTTNGMRPVDGFSKAKVRADALSGVKDWKFHDLRRTMRTHLSALPVQDVVRELVIAHAKQGLHKVYDLHSYRDEKRECLMLWEKRLAGILAPKPPADVMDLEAERSRRA